MIKSKTMGMFVCAAVLWLVGCSGGGYISTREQFCTSDVNNAFIMVSAQKILQQMHFSIDKFDVKAGYIKTLPLSGSQTFEFWRADSVGSFNQAEADLHTIRRTVELNITDGNAPGQICINCMAVTERLSMPQDITASGHNRVVMSGRQRAVWKLGERKADLTWVNLGRDRQLETEILNRLDKLLITAN